MRLLKTHLHLLLIMKKCSMLLSMHRIFFRQVQTAKRVAKKKQEKIRPSHLGSGGKDLFHAYFEERVG
eukprot:c29270_g2_i2 orf=2-202(-)